MLRESTKPLEVPSWIVGPHAEHCSVLRFTGDDPSGAEGLLHGDLLIVRKGFERDYQFVALVEIEGRQLVRDIRRSGNGGFYVVKPVKGVRGDEKWIPRGEVNIIGAVLGHVRTFA